MLPRDTLWRQGHVLTQASSSSLRLIDRDSEEKYAIVITHDCDLPHQDELQVELIVGSKVPKAENLYSCARSIRCLHLMYLAPPSLPFFIELSYAKRHCVDKEQFDALAKHNQNLQLPPEQKRILKQWLSARYGRAAFPNSFQTRLSADKKLKDKLTKIIASSQMHLIGIYFDLGENRFEELPDDTPYYLRISIVYDSLEGNRPRTTAVDCAAKITHLFHECFGTPDRAIKIALDSCEAIADIHFSIADLRKVDAWPLEYISLRENPQSSFLTTTEALT